MNGEDEPTDHESRVIPPGWPHEFDWPLGRIRFTVRRDLEAYRSYFGEGWCTALLDWNRPCRIVHRDRFLFDLRSLLGVSLTPKTSPNILIIGGPGTGKSLCVDHILSELVRRDNRDFLLGYVRFVWNKVRAFGSVVTPIELQFSMKVRTGQLPKWLPMRVAGVPSGDPTHGPLNLITVIEEADEGPPGQQVADLVELNRMREWDAPVRISTVILCRNESSCKVPVHDLETGQEWIRLYAPTYNFSELRDILQERISQAFTAGTVSPEAITRCVEVVDRTTHDPRETFLLLSEAADIAIEQQSRSIDASHIEEAIWQNPWRWDGR